jgi:hypothetical protein
MKKFHIALSVQNIQQSIVDYSERLNCYPSVIVPNEYALWRTSSVNFSIRKTTSTQEKLRHLGWEDSSANSFTKDQDVNGIVWENFSSSEQAKEINNIWPDIGYIPLED